MPIDIQPHMRFARIVAWKLYGKFVGRFDPSSKLCSCGVINNQLTLKDKAWTCNSCNTTHDRDILAANNIKRFALIKQNLVGQELPEVTLGEN